MSYNTKQRKLILNAIRMQSCEFTVMDIYNKISNDVGLTTIYRFIDKMVLDGFLNKTIGHDNITYYEYLEKCDEHNHFYLKCNMCGNILHVDCDCICNLCNHVYSRHKFDIDKEHIIICGICDSCRGKSHE